MTSSFRSAARVSPVAGEPRAGTIGIRRIDEQEFRVTASGLWTPGYADAHFRQLDAALAAARRPDRTLRVLVDLREAAVQPAGTAERVKFWTGSIYRREDRVAMLVASSLVKMQMRRVAAIATRELFLSENAALIWLGLD